MKLDNLTDGIKDFNKSTNGLLTQGIGGAAAGAGVSSYLSSRKQDPRETPAERRKRLMTSAAVGGGLGAATTTALPAGFKMLSEGYEPGFGENVGNLAAQGGVLAGGAGLGAFTGSRIGDRVMNGTSAARKEQARTVIRQILGVDVGSNSGLADLLDGKGRGAGTSNIERMLASDGAGGDYDGAVRQLTGKLGDPSNQHLSFLKELDNASDSKQLGSVAKRLLSVGGLDPNVNLIDKGKSLAEYLKAIGPKNMLRGKSFLRPNMLRGAGRAGAIGGLGALGLYGAGRLNDNFIRN